MSLATFGSSDREAALTGATGGGVAAGAAAVGGGTGVAAPPAGSRIIVKAAAPASRMRPRTAIESVDDEGAAAGNGSPQFGQAETTVLMTL